MNASPLLPPQIGSEFVHSKRRIALWFACAAVAGAVNAIALAACERYVSHVTGMITRIGFDAFSPLLEIEYIFVFLAFIVGAMTGVLVSERPRYRNVRGRPWAALGISALVIAITGVVGRLGHFGPFGGAVETTPEFVMLGMLSFAMGMQNASIAAATGLVVRTTHMSGPSTDIGVMLAYSFLPISDQARRTARRGLALRIGKVCGFTFGAVVGMFAARHLQYAALLVPALAMMLLASAVRDETPAQTT